MITIKRPAILERKLKATMDKYPSTIDKYIREATIMVQAESKKNWARITDGAPIAGSTANSRVYPRRTKPEGVRYITGRLNAGIQVRFEKKGGLAVLGAIGISSPAYGVEHERQGRKKVKGKYAFISPAYEATEAKRKRLRELLLRMAERKEV